MACTDLAILAEGVVHEAAHVELNKLHRPGAAREAADATSGIFSLDDDSAAYIDPVYGFGVSGRRGVHDGCLALDAAINERE